MRAHAGFAVRGFTLAVAQFCSEAIHFTALYPPHHNRERNTESHQKWQVNLSCEKDLGKANVHSTLTRSYVSSACRGKAQLSAKTMKGNLYIIIKTSGKFE